jgi:hypothetical protein
MQPEEESCLGDMVSLIMISVVTLSFYLNRMFVLKKCVLSGM